MVFDLNYFTIKILTVPIEVTCATVRSLLVEELLLDFGVTTAGICLITIWG